MGTTTIHRALLLALGATALLACAPMVPSVSALAVELDRIEPPALKARCGEAPLPPANGWVVFAMQGCRPCHEVINELKALQQAGRVAPPAVVAVGAPNCGAARQLAGGKVHAVTWIHWSEAAPWAVEAFPTLFLLSQGRVVRKVIGRPSADVLSRPPPGTRDGPY